MTLSRNLNNWEIEEFETLLLMFKVHLSNDKDRVKRKLNKNGVFTVKFFYAYYLVKVGGDNVNFPAHQIWKVKASSRITFFVWEATP